MTPAPVRREQVRAAELVGAGLTYAEAGAVVGRSERTVTRWLQEPDLRAIAAREGAVPGGVGPVEILRGALLATKASGQPDWPTRVSTARALAALRPDEVEHETEHQLAPSTVVYDLPPGAEPVLHRARGFEAPLSPAEAPSERPPMAWMREDTAEMVAERIPPGNTDVVQLYFLDGTPAEIDREAAALIEALAAGKEPPTSL